MQRKPMRNLLAWLLILAMLMSQLPATMIVASGEDSSGTEVTRAEWLSALVEAFDMSVESGDAPDNYFSDLSSDSEYYDDILLAVEFGVVNIEAGEAIYPDEAATRDFAVTTLNYCLGFQLDEDATYSFSDSDDCSSPDDAQVAVDRGWVSLISGKFCPDEAITSNEMDVMLTDVAEILADEEMEEDHENSYTFADFVVEIDEDITVEVEEDDDSDVVTIYSTDTGLVEGDTFVVYVEEEPYLYTAEAITAGSTYITVTTGEADLETAVLEMDIQEVVEADLSTFEAEDDVESVYLETEEEAAAYSASASVSLGKNVTYKAGTLIATKEFDLGDGSKASITFTMEDIDLNKNIKSTKNFSVSVTGTEIKASVFKNCTSLTSIVLPNALTTINKETFYGCISLASIEMPNTVTSIGKSLFYGCESLTDVTLSTALTELPESTFEGCDALTSIVLPNSITSIGESAFRKCYALHSQTQC